MSSLENPRPKKRRRSSFQSSLDPTPTAKKQKTAIQIEPTAGHRPPRFWDTLSKIRLSRGAIREFERRTVDTARPRQVPCSPDVQCVAVDSLQQLGRFARHGGPDLAHLRGFGALAPAKDRMSSHGRKRPSTAGASPATSKSKSSPYNGDFEQKLIDSGIYPEGHEHPGHALLFEPENMEEIQRTLRAPRPSLSPSRFSDGAYRDFKRLSARAANEAGVMADIFPIIAGEGRRRHQSMTDTQFTNMSPILEDVTAPKPDIYDGARPEQIDPRVRHSLGSYIVPSKKTHYPAAPNFFLEGKSAAGRADVARRQACYDGAVGARAMHTLQNYGVRRPTYDGNAYSFSNTYHAGTGTLQTYTHHLTEPKLPGGRPEYHTTQTRLFAMTDSRDSFCEGAAAFRNERDLAESNRNSFIEKANHAARHASTSSPSTTLPESQESRSGLYNDSDTSADDLALEDFAQKRHRHRSSTRQSTGLRPPPTVSKSSSRHTDGKPERKRDDVAPKHGRHARRAAEVGEEVRRRRPTQKLADSRDSMAESRGAKPKGRHDL